MRKAKIIISILLPMVLTVNTLIPAFASGTTSQADNSAKEEPIAESVGLGSVDNTETTDVIKNRGDRNKNVRGYSEEEIRYENNAEAEGIVSDSSCRASDSIPSLSPTYPNSSDKTEDNGIKWVWTWENNWSGIEAELTITDVSGKHDEESKIVITKDTSVPAKNKAQWDALVATGHTPSTPWVMQAVTLTDNGSQPATCTHGSSRELKATAIINRHAPQAGYNFNNESTWGVENADWSKYTCTFSFDEQEDAMGHSWTDPVVVWNDENGDGKYTKDEVYVSRTCRICGEKTQLRVVSVTEDITTQPTCTKQGKATYSVTYTDVDQYGKPTSNVTDTNKKNTRESVIKARGHDYRLIVEWSNDHKTAKKAILKCSRCDETEAGHTIDVTSSVTYKPAYYDDGTVVSNTATVIYDGKTYTESWIDDFFAASVSSWSKKPSVKTFVAGIPVIQATVDITSKRGRPVQTPIMMSANVVEEKRDTEKVTYKATVDLSNYYKPDYLMKYTSTEVTKEYTYILDQNGTPTDYEDPEQFPPRDYSHGSDKVTDNGVEWVWTYSQKTGIDAVLKLTDISGNYTSDESLITITKESKQHDKPIANVKYPEIEQGVEITDNGIVQATCTKGSRQEYMATAKLRCGAATDKIYEYTSTFSLDEQDDALGHTWQNPVVEWTDKNSDGRYTKDEVYVSRTCRACGEKTQLKVVDVTEEMSVQPTCTKDGEAIYIVTYIDIEGSTVTDTKKSNIKESVIKALDHKYNLEVMWTDDHSRATKATLVCSQCEDEEGHSVDVTASVTYETTYNEDGTVATNVAIYNAGKDDEVRSEKWEDDRIAATATFPSKKPSVKTFVAGVPVVEVKVELTSMKGKSVQTPITVPTKVVESKRDAKKITYKATVDLNKYYKPGYQTKYTATEVSNEYTYNLDRNGNPTDGKGSGDSLSEPEEQAEGGEAQNLFYTDVDLSIPGGLPEGAKTEGVTGKWTKYYKIDTDGSVTVIPTASADRKKAANASNSLIVLPIMDGGVKVSEFHYALPVFYQKPSLRLTSSSGTVKKGNKEGQVVKTTVTERKSNGTYETLDVSDQREGVVLYAPTNASAIKKVENDGAAILISATGKTSGKVQVQLDNWCEKIQLGYTVKESRKTVLTVDKKIVCMNRDAYENGESQTVTLFVNGSSWADEDISVTLPKNWEQKNIELDGINTVTKKVTDDHIVVSYNEESAPKPGNYTITLKARDNGKVSFRIVVSKESLNGKAVTLRKQTNMDLTKRQKMVLIPQLRGVGGEIQSVGFEENSAGEKLYDVEYEEELNQIYVTPKDWSASGVSAKNQNYTLFVEVGGTPCGAALKFTPAATKPTVKIGKVTLDKNKVKIAEDDSTGINAAANVLCTYKLGGKTFTIDPIDPEKGGVMFFDGNTELTVNASTGLYTMKNGATFGLEYDKSEGVLKLTDYYQKDGKGATVKVKLMFPGQVKQITKIFVIKTK